MSFDAITNRGEYLSAHYLAEVLPDTLKRGLIKRWIEEQSKGRLTPRAGVRAYRADYFNRKAEIADQATAEPGLLRKHHDELLRALGYEPARQTLTVERNGNEYQLAVAHAETGTGHGIVALDCGWAADTDAAHDLDDAARLLDPLVLDGSEKVDAGPKLASWLFGTDNPPRYVLLLNGGVITLADRTVWGEGRYLAVNLDLAYGRNHDMELDVFAALFGADSLRPPAEGGGEPLTDLVNASRQHAVGVSSELREGLRTSVELIANEVLDRIREAGYQPQQIMDLDELGKELGREALRYLYRILFLLYAEARPELGVLPVNDPEYASGYSLARLGDLVSRRLDPATLRNFHLYESLDLLFRMVNDGHRPRAGAQAGASESEGLRFEPMRSDLFLPEAIKLIGKNAVTVPGKDPDHPDSPKIDTRLRDSTLYQVLRLLMITKGDRRKRGGFISYAQLGINQLGAVYEGLMSYTGFVATEPLYEVAKKGDPKDGSWMIPASKADEYDDTVFVHREHPITGLRSRVSYHAGQFVYRLAGRDRQTSASYYTPQSLTEVTVQLALKYRLDQDGTTTPARELLDWTICEPALGSGAFLNEAINQVAAEYLRRRQEERKTTLDPEQYHLELQRAKAYIALHNCYGVDLNRTAVELAEVSLWLNVMHAGLQAPWFGLHLRRGNSLIGGRRQVYTEQQVKEKTWLTEAPADAPFRDGAIPAGSIHHFLLPADGWGAVAAEKEAKELAPDERERLNNWRRKIKSKPTPKQTKRLQALAGRVEYLWSLVQQRLAISEREIRRDIPVWGADDLPPVTGAVPREQILKDLEAPGTPYWRLKTLMDTWCALWFWPLHAAGLLDGSADVYAAATPEVTREKTIDVYEEPTVYVAQDLFGGETAQQLALPKKVGRQKVAVTEQLTRQVALTNLDDWITFAEGLIGAVDFAGDGLFKQFTSLDALSDHEEMLVGLMGMAEPHRLDGRLPWLATAVKIADEQGFFHWELSFAQVFAKGGFDLQLGNPPWVRPRWIEDDVLSETDPWFKLSDSPSPEQHAAKRAQALNSSIGRRNFTHELTLTAANVEYLTSVAANPVLQGTQPDYYRGFMVRVWNNAAPAGISGMLHPDTHFVGDKERLLRVEAYRRLRVHADFVNAGNRFFPPPVNRSSHFGMHIYARRGDVGFLHLSWLFGTSTLIDSLHAFDRKVTGGVVVETSIPGIRYKRDWDLRAHRSRVIGVDSETLVSWRRISGSTEQSVDQVRILYPVTTEEQGAIETLASAEIRLRSAEPRISRGYDEANAKKQGLIRPEVGPCDDWRDVILKGPQFAVATPFFKQPPNTGTGARPQDLGCLPVNAVPGTNYRRATDGNSYDAAQDRWLHHGVLAALLSAPEEVKAARHEIAAQLGISAPSVVENQIVERLMEKAKRQYTEFYRVTWREMIPSDTDRSLFVALMPPGPSHINAVRSMALNSNRLTVLVAGFWAALPLDYFLRVTGRGHLDVGDAKSMPMPRPDHPLCGELLLRTLRLNCLTAAYADIWEELHGECRVDDEWAVRWPGIAPLNDVTLQWNHGTPLRTEFERRSAMVELDALAAVMLGISVEQLIALYRSRFPIMSDYEDVTWFDINGRKIAGNFNSYGHGQTKEHYEQLIAHLEQGGPVPDGYTAPFYKADREAEYRQAHAVFSKRLQDAIDAGWRPE